MAGIGLIETRKGVGLPTGFYDLTKWDGLDTVAAQTGLVAVHSQLNAAIQDCINKDLTPVQPHSTKFMVTDTVLMRNLYPLNGGGTQLSPGSVSYVGEPPEADGDTVPEIILGAAATGFSNAASPKYLVHVLRQLETDTYPPATEDPATFFTYMLDGITINGNGFPGCDLLCADGAQGAAITNIILDGRAGDGGSGCKTGVKGLPGRGMITRNLKILGTVDGFVSTNTYTGITTSLGCGLINVEMLDIKSRGIASTVQRGGLTVHGLKITMSTGALYAIQAIGANSGDGGAVDITDAIIEMTDASSIGIFADDASVRLQRSYFKNCTTIVNNANSPDYAGNASGWYKVEEYVNSPAKIGVTSTSGADAYYLKDGSLEVGVDVASASNGTASSAPSDTLVSKYYIRPPWIMDTSKMIKTSDVTDTPAIASGELSTSTLDITTALQAKVDESIAKNKWLYIDKGWYKTSAPINLRSTGKIFGHYRNGTVISPLSSWITAQTALGVQSCIINTDASEIGDASMLYVTVDALPTAAARCGPIDGVWVKNARGKWLHNSMQTVGAAYMRSPMVFFRVVGRNITATPAEVGPWGSGFGGGLICSIRNDGSIYSGEVSLLEYNINRLRVVGVDDPLLIIGYDPEFGGTPYRAYNHAPLIEIINSKKVRLANLKTEATKASVSVVDSTVSISHIGQHRGYEPELVTNGTFANTTSWSLGTGVSISAGLLTCNTSVITNIATQTLNSIIAGNTYTVTWTITAITAASDGVAVSVGGVNGTTRTAVGTYTESIVAANTSGIIIMKMGAKAFAGSIDNVSVQSVTPLMTTGPVLQVSGTSKVKAHYIHTSTAYIPGDTTTSIVSDGISPLIAQKRTSTIVNVLARYTFGSITEADLPNDTWDPLFASSSVSGFTNYSGSLSRYINTRCITRLHRDVDYYNDKVITASGRSIPARQLRVVDSFVKRLQKAGVWNDVYCIQLWLGSFSQCAVKLCPNLGNLPDDVFVGFTSSNFTFNLGFTKTALGQYVNTKVNIDNIAASIGLFVKNFEFAVDSGIKCLIGSSIAGGGNRIYMDTAAANCKFTGQIKITTGGASASAVQTSPVQNSILSVFRSATNVANIAIDDSLKGSNSTAITPVAVTGPLMVFGQCSSIAEAMNNETPINSIFNGYYITKSPWTRLQLVDFLQELKLVSSLLGRF